MEKTPTRPKGDAANSIAIANSIDPFIGLLARMGIEGAEIGRYRSITGVTTVKTDYLGGSGEYPTHESVEIGSLFLNRSIRIIHVREGDWQKYKDYIASEDADRFYVMGVGKFSGLAKFLSQEVDEEGLATLTSEADIVEEDNTPSYVSSFEK